VEDSTGAAPSGEGKKCKIDPRRPLCSLRRKHTATPRDFQLALVNGPAIWFDFVATMLLDALTKHDPHLRDRLRAATAAAGSSLRCWNRLSADSEDRICAAIVKLLPAFL
jgi:hypothetical protein